MGIHPAEEVEMGSPSELGLALVQISLLVAGALTARRLVRRYLSPELVPVVLRQRIHAIDRLYAPVMVVATAVLVAGLALYRVS